jgi:hypothetical protein
MTMTTFLNPIRWFYSLIFWSGLAMEHVYPEGVGTTKAEFGVQVFHFQLLVLPQWYLLQRLIGPNSTLKFLITFIVLANLALVRWVLLSDRKTYLQSFSRWPNKRREKMKDLGFLLPFLAIPISIFWLVLIRA